MTSYTGALGANQDLVDAIVQSWGYVLPGASIQGTSGLRAGGRTSSQHYSGNAWDYGVTRADGTPVTWSDPEVAQAAEIFAALTGRNVGVGWGPTYMGGNYFHFDDGGNPHAPRSGVTVWSDDDGGASDSGPGAAQYGERLRAAANMPLGDVLAMYGLGSPDPLYGAPLGAPRNTPGSAPVAPSGGGLIAAAPGVNPSGNPLQEMQIAQSVNRNQLDPAAFMNRPLQAGQMLPFFVRQT